MGVAAPLHQALPAPFAFLAPDRLGPQLSFSQSQTWWAGLHCYYRQPTRVFALTCHYCTYDPARQWIAAARARQPGRLCRDKGGVLARAHSPTMARDDSPAEDFLDKVMPRAAACTCSKRCRSRSGSVVFLGLFLLSLCLHAVTLVCYMDLRSEVRREIIEQKRDSVLTLAGTDPTDPALTPGSAWSEADISRGVQAPEVRASKQACLRIHKGGLHERVREGSRSSRSPLYKRVKLKQLERLIFSSQWMSVRYFDSLPRPVAFIHPRFTVGSVMACSLAYFFPFFFFLFLVYFQGYQIAKVWIVAPHCMHFGINKNVKMDWICFPSATICGNQIPWTHFVSRPTLHLNRPWLIFQIYAACPAGFTAKEVSECTGAGGLEINWDTSRCKAWGVM